MTLRRRRRPLRPDALPPLRAQRPEAARGLARALAQLRRRPPARDRPRDRAPRVRPRHHALRPREQLRPAVRLGRGELRPAAARRTSARTATSSSSRRRPATTCGPARTASGARASTCSRASTRACARMGLDYVDIFYSHRFDPDTPLEETMGALDTAVRQGKALYVGISSYSPEKTREAAAILRRARHAAADPPAVVLDAQPLDRGRPARRARRARRRLHRLLAARAGAAHRPLPRRHPGGLARGRERRRSRRTMLTDEALARIRALNEIAARARPVARADGARLDAARPARHLDADRREQRRAARGERRRARPARLHATTSSPRSTATRSTAASTSGPRRARSDRAWPRQRQQPHPRPTRAAPRGRGTSRRRCATSCAPRPAAPPSCSPRRSPRSSGSTSTRRRTSASGRRRSRSTSAATASRMDLRDWVNSGLMTFFFFVVGLEARREFDMGELRERRRFALPLARRARRDGRAGRDLPRVQRRPARRRTAGAPRCRPTPRSRSGCSRSSARASRAGCARSC